MRRLGARKYIFVMMAIVVFLLASAAVADTVTDSTINVSYTMTGGPSPESPCTGSGSSTSCTYDITLTINASGYNGNGHPLSDNFSLVAIAVGTLAGQTGITFDASDSSLGFAQWQQGTVSANNCPQGGTGAFFCTSAPVGTHLVPGSYTFVYDVTVTGTPNGSGIVPLPTSSDIKAYYTDSAGDNGGLTSMGIDTQDTPAVPEPGSLALLGTGLVSIAGLIRRKLKG